MSDLTRYRISDDAMANTDLLAMVEHEDGDYLLGRLVPDDTLQQIADKLPEIIRSLELSENGGDVLDNVRRLNALLDGLVEES